MACDCIPRLTTSLRSGSYTKKAKVIAILGMLSMCCQSGPKTNQPCTPHDALLLCTAALPEVITVISRAGEPCCTCVVALTVPYNNVSCFTLTAYTDLLSCYRQAHMPGRLPSRLQMLPHTLHTSAIQHLPIQHTVQWIVLGTMPLASQFSNAAHDSLRFMSGRVCRFKPSLYINCHMSLVSEHATSADRLCAS